MMAISENFYTQTREEWLQEFFVKIDFGDILRQMIQTLLFRAANPDWERPVVMYGVRKQGHKFIKKQEIAVIIDKCPWSQRARMAETHWYQILYKRPVTDLEWQEVSTPENNRRYVVWHYFIENSWTIDKIVSHIVQDDNKEYGIDTGDVIDAFEKYYNRKIRIYKRQSATQLNLFNNGSS